MQEKILSNKKNGMLMLLVSVLLYFASIALIVFGAIYDITLLCVIGILWVCLGWMLFLGLKVLKPQEALVLTLFGYIPNALYLIRKYFLNIFFNEL